MINRRKLVNISEDDATKFLWKHYLKKFARNLTKKITFIHRQMILI